MTALLGMSPDELRGPGLGKRAAAAGADRAYRLNCYGTQPAAVCVEEVATGELLAWYVWDGPGGVLSGSRDTRVVQLADALDDSFNGRTPPAFTPPGGDIPSDGPEHDFSLDDDARAAVSELTPEACRQLMRHLTPRQSVKLKLMTQSGKYELLAFVNTRLSGGPAVQDVTPLLARASDGAMFTLRPDGQTERQHDL
jgi:hypothetical protein